MHIDNVKSLILSKFAYTKFSEKPHGQGYFLSEAFGGKEIAVRASHIEGCISLFFRQFRIGRINVEKRTFEFRRAYLIEGDPRLKDKA